MNKQFTITKRIAKHGKQAVILVPRIIEKEVKPGAIAKITIEIIKNLK